MSQTEVETGDVPEQVEEPEPVEEPTPEPEPDEEYEAVATPEPEPPVQHGRTEAELEGIKKKLDTSANTWRRRVEELLGEDFAALTVCELCGEDIPGFHWPAELVQPASELQDRLLRVLREPAAPEYRAATQVRECDHCAGWGKVKSGSHLAQHELVTCPACKGYGYVPPPVPSGNGYAEVAQVEGGGVGGEETEPPTDSDIWGSPRLLPDGQENPNYGKMPQYKIATLP